MNPPNMALTSRVACPRVRRASGRRPPAQIAAMSTATSAATPMLNQTVPMPRSSNAG